MNLSNINQSFIIENFKFFYEQVVLCKAAALSGKSIKIQTNEIEENNLNTEDFLGEEALGSSVEGAKSICEHLEIILSEQRIRVQKSGGDYVSRYYSEAEYIMTALADEIFLNLEWSGRNQWENNLLETKLFGSHVAGEKFFSNLDLYLKNRDVSARDIGVLYLWALGLGFQGKYKGGDVSVLQDYKDKLYEFLFFKNPKNINLQQETFFKEAYNYTINVQEVKKLPSLRYYNMTILGIMVGYFVFSTGLWLSAVHPISKEIKEIIEMRDTTKIEGIR